MVSKLLIQCATGAPYRAELQTTWARHSAYAAAHDFDFWHIQGWPGAIGWARFRLAEQAFDSGYEFVAWLDADAVIVDATADLADALPADGHIGAMYYDYADIPSGQPDHWNVGVFYARNTARVRRFLTVLLNEEPQPYLPWPAWWVDPHSEQRVFNALVQEAPWQTVPQRIDYRWNVIYGHEHGVPPVVLHLAGQTSARRGQLLRQIVNGLEQP